MSQPEAQVFTLLEDKAPVTAILIEHRRLVVGWPSYDSVKHADSFFKAADGDLFVVTAGDKGPKRELVRAAKRGGSRDEVVTLKADEFTRLEAGTEDKALVVCANPDEPNPSAFDNLTVEFAVRRLPEMKERLVEAIVHSSGPAFHFERSAVSRALTGLENRIS